MEQRITERNSDGPGAQGVVLDATRRVTSQYSYAVCNFDTVKIISILTPGF